MFGNSTPRFQLTFEEAIKLVQPLILVEPGPATKEALAKYQKSRSATLWYIQPIDGKCAWCNVVELPKRRRKYCSEACSNSSIAYCYPQSNHNKGHILLFKQNCACAGCGLSFEELVRKKIESHLNWAVEHNEYSIKYGGRGKTPVNNFSPFYAVANSGNIIQVDHIEEIHRGGDGIGFENVQVLCIKCHTAKTINERNRS